METRAGRGSGRCWRLGWPGGRGESVHRERLAGPCEGVDVRAVDSDTHPSNTLYAHGPSVSPRKAAVAAAPEGAWNRRSGPAPGRPEHAQRSHTIRAVILRLAAQAARRSERACCALRDPQLTNAIWRVRLSPVPYGFCEGSWRRCPARPAGLTMWLGLRTVAPGSLDTARA